jgi:hypothetical protein
MSEKMHKGYPPRSSEHFAVLLAKESGIGTADNGEENLYAFSALSISAPGGGGAGFLF